MSDDFCKLTARVAFTFTLSDTLAVIVMATATGTAVAVVSAITSVSTTNVARFDERKS